MPSKIKATGSMILIAALLISAAAHADTPTTLQGFLTCSRISDDSQRLACFDGAAKSLSGTLAQSPADAKKAREESFGHEALPAKQRGDEIQPQDYRAKVAVFSSDAYGNLVLVLENGQVWRQTDGLKTQLLTGEQWVKISRAAMGSYLITLEGARRTYRFKRLK